MKMPLMFKLMNGGCGDASEYPMRMFEMEGSGQMPRAFVGRQRFPIFWRDIHIGEYAFEFKRLRSSCEC